MREAIAAYLQAVGIRTRIRTMERAAFLTAFRERKLHGVVVAISCTAGNAAPPGTRPRGLCHAWRDLRLRSDPRGRRPVPASGARARSDEARGPPASDPAHSARPGDPRAPVRTGPARGRQSTRGRGWRGADSRLSILGAIRGPEAQGPLTESRPAL